MKKRLLAGLLSLAMVLTLLPVSAFAASDIPSDYVPIYTLADLKENIGSGYYLLMNDIDASAEDIAYDTLNKAACGSLPQGGVINGNGHTIYNLKSTLIEKNLGTIKNLNVTVINADKDNDVLGSDNGICGIAYYNSSGDYKGLIENCNVRMTVHRSFDKMNIGFVACGVARGCGTIRNCIVDMDLDFKYTGTNKDSDISVAGIGDDSRFADIDHCLVMGSVNIQTPGYARLAGISDEDSKNSANALEKVNVECTSSSRSAYDFFTLSSASSDRNSGGQSINNRVADDLAVNYTFNGRTVLDGKPEAESKLYTLASRENILNDWDVSNVPSETPPTKPEPGDNTPVTVGFNFEGNVGHTQSWQFEYSDDYFYAQDDGYGYNAKLAKASLCLEMTTFSTNANTTWRGDGDPTALSRTENVRELLNKLNFSSLKYVNYDVPLDDTSDKVAYTLAMKYIKNKDGSTDTLIAVPIRGGGYGGEWASNFNVYNSEEKLSRNHYGFQTAANGVLSGLSDYVQSHEIKGDLKIWAVGFSRGAAVANLLGRALNNATIGGIKPNVVDIYVYTFATPAGASRDSAETFFDPNIFNIVSPVDLVPRVAPTAWGFTRYGTTLSLPYESSSKLWDKFEEIAGMYTREIKPSQRAFLDRFCEVAFTSDPGGSVFGKANYTDIQQDIMDFTGSELGTPPSSPFEKGGDTLRCVLSNDTLKYVLGCAAFNYTLIPLALLNLNTLGLAHYPEHYLAHLEVDNLQSEDDFISSYHARAVLVYPPADKQLKSYDIKVDFWNAKGQSAGSYANGTCSSGEVDVEMTDIGLIASLPEGAEYSFTVSGADTGEVGAKIYSYDGADIEPARTVDFDGLPTSGGDGCTVFVPEDIYSDYYAQDSDGNIYEPDSDSEYPDAPDVPDTPDVPMFDDVPEGAFYYEAVQWAVDNEITNGTGNNRFEPNGSCTRGQIVTFLWRAAGKPTVSKNVSFTDVKPGAFYYDAVKWAVANGITNGTGGNKFSPDAICTRAETVTFLYRANGSPAVSGRSGFTDVPSGVFYNNAVIWAIANNITNGTGGGKFSPNDTCTRGQVVTFLYRAN